MSIRIAFLTLLVVSLAIYAWRDWFVSLCGLVLMMALLEHPDMPKNIGGIQGLNPWNALMAPILLAWLLQRRSDGLIWDMPRYISVCLLLYLAVILVGVARMFADRTNLEHFNTSSLLVDTLINCIKWVIPGLLMFEGCRNSRHLRIAVVCILGLYLLLALQVIRWMPPSSALSGDQLNKRALRVLDRETGYQRCDLSMMLAGASWAMIAAVPLATRRWQRAALIVGFLLTAYGQALTGGRMGYVTWGVVGVILCLLKWRKRLLYLPIAIALVFVLMPGATDRLLQGFGQTDLTGGSYTDDSSITSGRTLIWPHVVDAILKSPAIGYGRMGMNLTGLSALVVEGDSGTFPHPHNAYLEFLLDNGFVGFALVMPFYAIIILGAATLFRDRRHPFFEAVGGITCALLLAMLVASMGAQTFYPREGVVGLWAAMGLMLRLSVARLTVRTPNELPTATSVPAVCIPPCCVKDSGRFAGVPE